jgi:hypothetical protein
MKQYTFKKLFEASTLLKKRISEEVSEDKKLILLKSYLDIVNILKK